LGQITTVNPTTGEEITTFSTMDKNQVFGLVRKARRAYPEWKKDYEERRSYIYNLVEYLRKNKTNLAKVATSEMGKPLKESIGEIEKCAPPRKYKNNFWVGAFP
jgi:succinate-semialdehyde dehydrogenase/glutarate-semialdehyde dehydrogenase/succinyl-CoA reductase